MFIYTFLFRFLFGCRRNWSVFWECKRNWHHEVPTNSKVFCLSKALYSVFMGSFQLWFVYIILFIVYMIYSALPCWGGICARKLELHIGWVTYSVEMGLLNSRTVMHLRVFISFWTKLRYTYNILKLYKGGINFRFLLNGECPKEVWIVF